MDQKHYPEQHEVKNSTPTSQQVPEKKPKQAPLEAEAQQSAAEESHNVTNSMKRKGGSVQRE